jgi:hypothetical protein
MDSEKLRVAVPRWSRDRVTAEAIANWNLRHPESPAGPDSEWSLIANVVLAFARHAWSNYDQIVTPETRDNLQARIRAEAQRAYPWLRGSSNPPAAQTQEPQKADVRIFEHLSREFCELSSRRSAAMLAFGELKRKRPLDRKMVDQLQAEIDEADAKMKRIFSVVQPDEYGDRHLVVQHESDDYWWLGQKLPLNYVEPVPGRIICPACEARLWRTKKKIDCGAGVRAIAFSCHCFAACGSDGRANEEWWRAVVETGCSN